MEDNSTIIAKLDREVINIPDKLDVPYTRTETINSIAISIATFTFVACLPMLSGKEIPIEYRIGLGGLFSLVFVYLILHKTKKRQADYDAQQTEYADFIGNVRSVVSDSANKELTYEQLSQINEGETVDFMDGHKVWMTKDKVSAFLHMGPAPVAT